MSFSVLFTLAVVLFLVIFLYKEYLRPALVFMIAISLLLVGGIITPGEALSGFANEQIAVIFLLLLISDIIRSSGVLNGLADGMFNKDLSYRGFMVRMTSFVSFFSAWVNNTPLVAIMIPYTWQWASRKGISPSKVLMPLSFAAIIGGMITLIGTSTNLVVNGLAAEASQLNSDIQPLGIFDFTAVGLPLAVTGLIYLWIFSSKGLPERKDPLKEYEEDRREYIIEAEIPESSEYIGLSVEQTLRHLGSLYLAEIVRSGTVIGPVAPDEMLQKGDLLLFTGDTQTIIELVRTNKNVRLPDLEVKEWPERTQVVEVVVSATSGLTGATVRDIGFRGAYDAVIIAIRRDGERLTGSIGDQVLRSGDLLLLLTGHDFKQLATKTNDFYTISVAGRIEKISGKKKWVLIGGTLGVVITSAMTSLALFKGLLILLILLALTRTVSFGRIKKNLDAELFVVLALALAVGTAINNSGAADYLAQMIISVSDQFASPVLLLLIIYLMTNLLSMVVTNKASVAIVFPVAMAMVEQLRSAAHPELPYAPFILAVAFAGCAEFITPVGYQTNLMVYGPGGYKFGDYLRFGLPLTLLYLIMVVLILSIIYNLY